MYHDNKCIWEAEVIYMVCTCYGQYKVATDKKLKFYNKIRQGNINDKVSGDSL
jgi:hypothetical protein